MLRRFPKSTFHRCHADRERYDSFPEARLSFAAQATAYVHSLESLPASGCASRVPRYGNRWRRTQAAGYQCRFRFWPADRAASSAPGSRQFDGAMSSDWIYVRTNPTAGRRLRRPPEHNPRPALDHWCTARPRPASIPHVDGPVPRRLGHHGRERGRSILRRRHHVSAISGGVPYERLLPSATL